MTKKETALILATLKAAYPSFYRELSPDDAQAAANLWQTLFADEPYDLVLAAVQALIKTRTSTFPPVPGEVTEQIRKLTHPDELSAEDAWSLVQRASSRGIYNATEEFNALPRAVQRAIGTPAQLRAWAVVDPQEFETVVASNFRRAYETMVRRSHELDALPAGAKEVMTAISGAVFKTLPEGRIDE